MRSSLADAVAAYTAGVDALCNADLDTSTHHELLTALADIETGSRRTPTLGYAILARLQHEATPTDLGATSWWKLLTLRTRISKGEAHKRLQRARRLAPRRTLQGEHLPPDWEHTATALAHGLIGEEHLEVIRRFFTALPATVDPITRSQAEATLARAATELDPRALTTAAIHLLALLHPDGDAPADTAARKAGLHLGGQQPDGLSYLSGWITPTLRALLEPVLAKFTERGRHPEPTDPPVDLDPARSRQDDPFTPHPGDTAPPAPEPVLDPRWRTRAQYTHDALTAALTLLLRSHTLGTLNGLPTTVVVTTTLQDLEAATGYALTAGGTRLPMRDLIAMAADAHHYLAVFDGHTNAALHLGRAQRCATGTQKLVLFARDRGCTAPGCDVPFYTTHAHHGTADWKHHGRTDIDALTLACGPDNLMIDTTDWTTRRRPDGHFEWIPPPHLDTGQPRTNNLHHPERHLTPEDDDPL
jgi:hypothetical protein